MKKRMTCLFVFFICVFSFLIVLTVSAEEASRPIPKNWPKVVTMGGSYVGSGAYMVYVAISDAITKELGVPAQVVGGMTTAQNIKLQEQEQIIGGMQTGDTIMTAILGEGAFKKKALKKCRTLIHHDIVPFMFVSYRGSGVTTGADLKGKKWMVLKPGGVYGDAYCKGLHDAHGWTYGDIHCLPWGSLKQLPDGIKSKTVHAIMMPCSPGSPQGEDLARSVKLTYITLTEKEADAMKKQGPYLQDEVLPPNTYYGQSEPLRAIGLPTFFGVGSFVPESLVYEICKILMTDPKRFTKVHPSFGDTSFQNAFMAAPPVAPYHPGVIKYLKEKGLWNDQLQTWHNEAESRIAK